MHLTPHRNLMSGRKSSSVSEIVTANNEKMKVFGMGNISMSVGQNEIDIENVLHIPELSPNLLSVDQVKHGNTVIFSRNGCHIYNSCDELLMQTEPTGGIFKIKGQHLSCLVTSRCHLNYGDLCRMKNGLYFSKDLSILKKCEGCMKGKHTRLSFKHTGTRTNNLLDHIHSDLCGPMENKSFNCSRYF